MELTKDQLRDMFVAVAEIAVQAYKSQLTPQEDRLSQREAFRQFGSANVKRWQRDRKITGARCEQGERSTIFYSKTELQIIYQSEKKQLLN